MQVFQGLIYKAKRGCVCNTDSAKDKKYNCYIPCMTGDYAIVDCLVVNQAGDRHPEYENSGVPVYSKSLGAVVGRLDCY